MTEIDLYYARSGNSLRAAIALELSQMPYRLHALDLTKMAHKQDDFLNINPAGHVPAVVLTRGGERTVLVQSGAILEYFLRQSRPDLWPKDEIKRALCMVSVYSAVSDIALQNAYARYLSGQPEAAQFALGRLWSDLLTAFRAIQDTPYLCGSAKTIADYAHFPVVYMREARLRKDSRAGHIVDWLERMKADEAVARAVSFAGVQIADENADTEKLHWHYSARP